MSSMQIRNQENFTAGKMSKGYRNNNCKKNNKLLNEINIIENNACSIDDNKTNDQVNNERLTCRAFNERKIFLGNDTNSWCKNVKNLPKIKEIKEEDIKPFESLKLSQNLNLKPEAIEENNNFSNFPFKSLKKKLPNYDNQLLSKKK